MPQPRDFEQETLDHPEHRYKYDFDAVLRRYVVRAFSPFLTKGNALELGCFEGDFTILLAPMYSDLTVVEVVESAIATTRERVGAAPKFVHGAIETVDLPQNHYDAIFLVHVLEHLDDPVGVMRRINGWLSPNGRLFLACPNANAPSRQIAVKMGLISHATAVTPGEAAHGHRRTYTLDTLERDAREGGLSIVHRCGAFFKPLANYQFDRILQTDILSPEYLDGCYDLGTVYPDLCASACLVCSKGASANS